MTNGEDSPPQAPQPTTNGAPSARDVPPPGSHAQAQEIQIKEEEGEKELATHRREESIRTSTLGQESPPSGGGGMATPPSTAKEKIVDRSIHLQTL